MQYRVAQPGEVLSAGGRVLNLVDLGDVYMTFFLPTAQAGRVALGAEVRLVLDAAPQYVIPAEVSFVADVAQFTPKTRGDRGGASEADVPDQGADRRRNCCASTSARSRPACRAWPMCGSIRKAEWPADLQVRSRNERRACPQTTLRRTPVPAGRAPRRRRPAYGKTRALDAVSLDMPAGCMVGLIGPDGVGKSSLLSLIAGARCDPAGRVEVLGGDMADARHRRAVCPRIAYMPQGLRQEPLSDAVGVRECRLLRPPVRPVAGRSGDGRIDGAAATAPGLPRSPTVRPASSPAA